MKRITIIGGGLSGLAASCYLAKNNFKVQLIEKNNSLGGRINLVTEKGFIFDSGPSWYWMPEVFEQFFKDFGKHVSDFYNLKRLDPSYKYFTNKTSYDIPASSDKLNELFEKIEPGSSLKLQKFIKESHRKYEISMNKFIYLSNNSIADYLSVSMLKYLFSLDIFKSLRKHISRFFKQKVLRELLEFPSMFLGGTPNNTPALYSLMNYADIVGGTWYPIGGMYKISEAFSDLSKELGVMHILNEEIEEFNIKDGKIISAKSKNKTEYFADVFLCCAEYPHVQLKLINDKYRSYKNSYWNNKDVAPSALIFYLGINTKIKNIRHHNLFFDKDFDKHLNDIFTKNILPTEPLFYVCCPSKTDNSIIPDKSMENLFILIPIAPGSEDTEEIREKYFNQVLKRIENATNQRIKNNIIVKKSFSVKDFKSKYNSYKGNAYGLANSLFQTAFLKPKIKDKKITNLYYTGHFTVPGPGLPPAIISGKIASNEIIKDSIR
tara:strand:+ start:1038 stop:2513 length:1476 start_codon:yes stop_codon:yes gene_type:complete